MKIYHPRHNLLMRLLIGGVTLLVSVSACYSYQVVRNLTLESLKKNAFLEAQGGSEEIDLWLKNLKVHIETLASTPIVRSMDWATIKPYLKAEILRFEDVSAIAIAKPNGWRNGTNDKRINIKDRLYFQKAITGQTNISDPQISRTMKIRSIAIATPIRQEFSIATPPVGEIHSIVKLDRMVQVVEQLKYGDRSYAFVLNSKGEIIAHPNPALLLSTVENPIPSLVQATDKNLAAIARRMIDKQQSIELVQIEGTWKYVAFLPLKEADWSVALVIPRENIELPLRSLDLMALVVAGLAIVTIWMLWQFQAVEQAQLKKSNEDLEQRVLERTAELSTALEKLKQSQFQLVQNEKMSSLGQLVAGVAHEINNPVNFIHGNLYYVNDYTQNLLSLIHLCQEESIGNSPKLQAAIAEIDLEFVADDLPKILTSMQVGTDRIREIVRSLRNFSRMDEAEKKTVDIHDGIDSTLLILQHRLKAKPGHPEIQVVKQYGNLPPVECYAGQLNQVFMNVLTNAIDAIDQHMQDDGAITISTDVNPDEQIKIGIADNGTGISEEVQQRLFDPFYTTKPIGKGTGLGLAISHQIVVEKHGGTITCISSPGKGTEFVIQIPMLSRF